MTEREAIVRLFEPPVNCPRVIHGQINGKEFALATSCRGLSNALISAVKARFPNVEVEWLVIDDVADSEDAERR